MTRRVLLAALAASAPNPGEKSPPAGASVPLTRRETLGCIRVPLASVDGKAPAEFRVWGNGYTQTTKGTFYFDEESGKSCIQWQADYGNDTVIDYNHGTEYLPLFGGDPALMGKAAGWCRQELRSDGLWATGVSWTPAAKAGLEAREWRYFSPVVELDESGRVLRCVSIAITNTPATHGMDALMASALEAREHAHHSPAAPLEPEMSFSAALKKSLSLPENATDAQCEQEMANRERDRAALLTSTGKGNFAEALAHVHTQTTAAQRAEKAEADLVEERKKSQTAELSRLYEDGVREGKLTPALKEWFTGQSLESARKFLSAAPALVATDKRKLASESSAGNSAKDGTTATLTKEDRRVAAQMGIDEKKLLATRERHGGRVPVGKVKEKDSDEENETSSEDE